MQVVEVLDKYIDMQKVNKKDLLQLEEMFTDHVVAKQSNFDNFFKPDILERYVDENL